MDMKTEDLLISSWGIKGIRIVHRKIGAMVMCDTEDCVDRNRGLALEMLTKKLAAIHAEKNSQ